MKYIQQKLYKERLEKKGEVLILEEKMDKDSSSLINDTLYLNSKTNKFQIQWNFFKHSEPENDKISQNPPQRKSSSPTNKSVNYIEN